MESGLKGAETRVGYLVLEKVSKNLPLLISAPTRLAVCPMLMLPASRSAPASSQDCPWAGKGSGRAGWGTGEGGCDLGGERTC